MTDNVIFGDFGSDIPAERVLQDALLHDVVQVVVCAITKNDTFIAWTNADIGDTLKLLEFAKRQAIESCLEE
jgi:hypothetical protein